MENLQQQLAGIIAFNVADGFLAVHLKDIVFLEARGSYSIICITGQPELLMAKNLKEMEKILPAGIFLRVHHKYMVSKLHVRRFTANGKLTLLMSNGKKVEVSIRRRQVLTEAFKRI